MGNKVVTAIPVRAPIGADKTRVCVTGFTHSHHTNRAAKLAKLIAAEYPTRYESWVYLDGSYREENGILNVIKKELREEQQNKFAEHRTSPFCWTETAEGGIDAKGGRDKLCEWAIASFPDNEKIVAFASKEPSLFEAVWTTE